MKLFLNFFCLILISILQLSCTQNALSEMGSKSTDDALLVDAQTALNNQDYQTAINIVLNQISSGGQQRTDVKVVLAGGYAGKCGLNFLNFVDSLSKATTGTAFKLVSTPFVGLAVDPDSCLLALNAMESIGPSASRTSSQNAFVAILGMSLMGSGTRFYTDNTPVNGDGTQDAAKISCTLTDPQMTNIVLGFGFMVQNFSYLSTAQLGSSSQTAFTDVINMCSTLGGSSCNITTAAAVTAGIRDAMRRLMETAEYGVGTTVTAGNPAAILGACP